MGFVSLPPCFQHPCTLMLWLTFIDDSPCPSDENVTPVVISNIFRALFVTLQLYMIFKYSNVIVNRSKRLAKLVFMHCVVSSLCFWLSGIVNETRQSLVIHAIEHHPIQQYPSDGKNMTFYELSNEKNTVMDICYIRLLDNPNVKVLTLREQNQP